jgi:hypothetical protein
MAGSAPPWLGLVALLVIAPIGAAVLIGALLLFGANPHWVFLPGHAVKSAFQSFGVRVPNAVGVLSTVAVWWAILVAVWFAVRRLWSTAPRA